MQIFLFQINEQCEIIKKKKSRKSVICSCPCQLVLSCSRPQEVHSTFASQGLKVGLYNPTILGGNFYLSWFNDRGAMKDPPHTGTSKGQSQALNRGPVITFLPKYANVYVTIQSHGPNAGARTHYVTANVVRDGLELLGPQ